MQQKETVFPTFIITEGKTLSFQNNTKVTTVTLFCLITHGSNKNLHEGLQPVQSYKHSKGEGLQPVQFYKPNNNYKRGFTLTVEARELCIRARVLTHDA